MKRRSRLFQIMALILAVLALESCIPDSIARRITEARYLYETERYEEAIVLCTELIHGEPGNLQNIQIYRLRGRSYLNIEDYASAVDDFTSIMESGLTDCETLSDRSYAYGQMEEWDKAVEDAGQLIELCPYAAQYWNTHGWALIHVDEYERAMVSINKSLDMNERDNNTWDSRAVCYYEMGDYKNALSDINRAIELNATYAEHYYHRAQIYLATGNNGAAVDDLDKALQLDPSYDDARELLREAENALWDQLESGESVVQQEPGVTGSEGM